MMIKRLCGKLINQQLRYSNISKFSSVCELDVKKNVGQRVTVKGWVRSLRKMKTNVFLDINDGTTSQNFQVVLKNLNVPNDLNCGCSVSLEGEVSVAPNGSIELQADKVFIIGNCDLTTYPFLPRKQYSADYVRQYLHLRPRTRTFSSTMRLRDLATRAIHEHFWKHNFINVQTPILTSNDCEGAGEIFLVKPSSTDLIEKMKKQESDNPENVYFDTKTYLSVSGQLHLEACARSLTKVYNFNPTFRAENSKSRLHLSEFYMIEAELAFMSTLKHILPEAELLIKSITLEILQKGAGDLKNLEVSTINWLEKDFGVMTFEEAIDILKKNSHRLDVPLRENVNLTKEHELLLVEYNNGIPLFIVEFPKTSKPFYMKECEADHSRVLAFDLLAPITGEIIGGGVREDNYVKLKEKVPKNVNLEWYMELRKFGNVPTAGFGMGFERYLQLVLGIPNIKDVIPFPRWPHNCHL